MSQVELERDNHRGSGAVILPSDRIMTVSHQTRRRIFLSGRVTGCLHRQRARGGRDLWLGIALIVLAALFGLRSVALDEERREHETKRLLDDFKREIVAQLPDPNLGAFRTPPPGQDPQMAQISR